MGQQAAQSLRPQQRFGHVWFLQRTRARQVRLQVIRQRTTRLRFRGAGFGRAISAPLDAAASVTRPRVCALPISFRGSAIAPTQKNTENFSYPIARYLYILSQQRSGEGYGPARKGIHEIRPFQAGPGSHDQGWLLSAQPEEGGGKSGAPRRDPAASKFPLRWRAGSRLRIAWPESSFVSVAHSSASSSRLFIFG